jgi:hypothetical protein
MSLLAGLHRHEKEHEKCHIFERPVLKPVLRSPEEGGMSISGCVSAIEGTEPQQLDVHYGLNGRIRSNLRKTGLIDSRLLTQSIRLAMRNIGAIVAAATWD